MKAKYVFEILLIFLFIFYQNICFSQKEYTYWPVYSWNYGTPYTPVESHSLVLHFDSVSGPKLLYLPYTEGIISTPDWFIFTDKDPSVYYENKKSYLLTTMGRWYESQVYSIIDLNSRNSTKFYVSTPTIVNWDVSIVPYPGKKDMFFLPLISAPNISHDSILISEIYNRVAFGYAILDMSLNKGKGDIVEKELVLPDSFIDYNSLEIIHHKDKKSFWIIVGRKDATEYSAYLLDSTGISKTPVKSSFSNFLHDSLYQINLRPKDSVKYSKHYFPAIEKYKLVFSRDGTKMARSYYFYNLASAPYDVGNPVTNDREIFLSSDYFEVYDFDNSSGRFTNRRGYRFRDLLPKLGLDKDSDKIYWGYPQFSPDGSKLYILYLAERITFSNTSSYLSGVAYGLIQLDLLLDSATMVNNLINIVGPFIVGFPPVFKNPEKYNGSDHLGLDIQTGPDNKIYFTLPKFGFGTAIFSSEFKNYLNIFHTLNVIHYPNRKGKECKVELEILGDSLFADYVNYNDFGFKVEGKFFRYLDFPRIILSSPIVRVQPQGDTVCEGEMLVIKGNIQTSVSGAEIEWSGPNGFSSNDSNIVIPNPTVEMSGWYKVKVNLNDYLAEDSVYVLVTPNPRFSLAPSGRVTLCRGQSVELKVVPLDSNLSFVWSTGDTTTSIRVDKAGMYYVTATNEYGCQRTDSIEVIEAVGERLRGLSYDFGIKEIGTSEVHRFRFENTTADELLVTNAFAEDSEGVFTLTTNPPLPARIKAGEGIDFEVEFTPKEPKRYTARIILSIEEPCGEIDTADVTGAGLLRMYVRLPKVTGLVGERDYCIELLGKPKSATTKAIEIDYTTELHWDASDYLARRTNPAVIERNEISKGRQNLQLSGKFQLNEGGETKITDICGEVLLSESKATPLVIETFDPKNELIEVEILNGELTTTGVCAFNLRAIELLPERVLFVRPNPAREEIEIEIRGGTDDTYKIEFITSSGGVIYATKGILKERKQIMKLRTEAISSGLYQVRAMIGGEVRTAEVVVMK